MQLKEAAITRKEIEARLSSVGDYVKMDYLQQCLKKHLDFDTKRFVLVTLAGIYESRRIYYEAGKLLRAAADINATSDAQANDFIKSTELFIKAGKYDDADISLSRALGAAKESQKTFIQNKIKETYKKEAQELLKKDKRKNAIATYEKLLTLNLNPLEKKDSQQALLSLYEKVGKVREFLTLKRSLSLGYS